MRSEDLQLNRSPYQVVATDAMSCLCMFTVAACFGPSTMPQLLDLGRSGVLGPNWSHVGASPLALLLATRVRHASAKTRQGVLWESSSAISAGCPTGERSRTAHQVAFGPLKASGTTR